MPDEYSSIFSEDPRAGLLTYPQLVARRQIAAALATRNRPYPKTIGEGLTAFGEGLGQGMYNQNLERAEAAYQRQSDETVRRLSGADAGTAPAAATAAAPQPDAATTEQAAQKPQMDVEELVQRYARNESGGAEDPYSLVGRVSRRGDYPYGKYQVMGRNIPTWTAQYLGKEMTPKEFLLDKQAQEDLARARGGELLAKYGPEGAAAAWFAGEKGMKDPNRKDVLGTTVAEYVRRFNVPLGSREQVVASAARAPAAQAFAPEDQAPVQVASLGGGMPAPDTARDAIAQSLMGQQQPEQPQQPQAQPPVQVAQAPQQQLPIGRPPPAIPQGPPAMPRQEPMTQREMEIRRAIGASADPTLRGRLEPLADRLEAERKFKDAQNMELWKKDVIAYEKRTDPLQQAQIQKLRGETYDAEEKRALVHRIGGRDPEAFFKGLDQEKDAVARQGHMLSQIAFAESAINAGVISGFGADARINFAKMRDWMFNNKIEGDLASNTERLQAAAKSMLGQAVQNIQGKDPRVSEGDIRVASGTIAADPSYQLETMKKILADNKRVAIRSITDYEDKVDNYLAGHRSERNYQLPPIPTDKSGKYASRLLEHRDNDEAKQEYDKYFGEGAADLEIARAKRREKRGGK